VGKIGFHTAIKILADAMREKRDKPTHAPQETAASN
jgi:hypothetical protein